MIDGMETEFDRQTVRAFLQTLDTESEAAGWATTTALSRRVSA